jgi:hypothetical protein
MGARVGRWVNGTVVAWTESDGPGELPRLPSRRLAVAAVLAAGVAGWGMLSSDDVCPEHSLLIDVVGGLALVLTVLAIVAALRASVLAAPLVLAASAFGVVIGVVDALHDVTRSRIVAIGFGVAAVAAAFSAVQSLGLRLWGRRVLSAAQAPVDFSATATSDAAPTAATRMAADEPAPPSRSSNSVRR